MESSIGTGSWHYIDRNVMPKYFKNARVNEKSFQTFVLSMLIWMNQTIWVLKFLQWNVYVNFWIQISKRKCILKPTSWFCIIGEFNKEIIRKSFPSHFATFQCAKSRFKQLKQTQISHIPFYNILASKIGILWRGVNPRSFPLHSTTFDPPKLTVKERQLSPIHPTCHPSISKHRKVISAFIARFS